MKLRLNTTEMLDWQEVWCFRCKHDHLWSHHPNDEAGDGCPLLLPMVMGEDVPQFHPRDPDWWRMVPAPVSCDNFEVCDCPSESPEMERRQGLTRRQFFDQERERVLALPIHPDDSPC